MKKSNSYYLDEETIKALDKVASADGRSASSYLNRLLVKLLKVKACGSKA